MLKGSNMPNRQKFNTLMRLMQASKGTNEVAIKGRMISGTATPADSAYFRGKQSFSDYLESLKPQKAPSPASVRTESAAARKGRFISGKATAADSAYVRGEQSLRDYVASLKPKPKPKPRPVGEAGEQFEKRLIKDRKNIGDVPDANTLALKDFLKYKGYTPAEQDSLLSESSPIPKDTSAYRNAQERIAANTDSTKMVETARKMGYKVFDGEEHSFIADKTYLENYVLDYNKIAKEQGRAAADQWLAEETGGRLDFDRLAGNVNLYRGR